MIVFGVLANPALAQGYGCECGSLAAVLSLIVFEPASTNFVWPNRTNLALQKFSKVGIIRRLTTEFQTFIFEIVNKNPGKNVTDEVDT